MPINFVNGFYLGVLADLDPTETNFVPEDSADLEGLIFGSAISPLHDAIITVGLDDVDSDGTLRENDNGQTAETLIHNGTASALDSVVEVEVSMTYSDGMSETTQMIFAQDISGRGFLLPYTTGSGFNAVLDDKPIESITLTSVIGDNYSGVFANPDPNAFIDGTVDGSEGDDSMGTTFTDTNGTVMNAYGGRDTVAAGAGNDTVDGGAGDDTIFGDSVRVDITANISGTPSPSTVLTVVNSSDAQFELLWIEYDGTLMSLGTIPAGAAGAINTFEAHNFVLRSDEGELLALVNGNEGTFTYGAGGLADSLSGGAGADTLHGQLGNDTLDGGTGNDTVYGGSGDDLVQVADNFGTDALFGGDGISDMLDLVALASGVNVTLASGTSGSFSDGTGTGTFDEFEIYVLTNQADTVSEAAVSLIGTFDLGGGDDLFEGSGAGAETVFGGSGNDTIVARGNLSSVSGGDGDDEIGVQFGANSTLDGGAGNDTLQMYFGSGGTLLGGTGNDSLLGRSGADALFGGDDDDTLRGAEGADTLDGGTGDDTIVLENSYGADDIFGGEDIDDGDVDTLDASAVSNDGVDVSLITSEDGSITSTEGTANFVDIERFVLTGLGDTFDGSGAGAGINVSGGAGADSVSGGMGNDSLFGGLGSDSLSGGDGDDIIEGGDDDDVLTSGRGNDTLFGGDGNDTLMNSTGDDTLVGGSGDDTLVATYGNDSLFGGTGNDTLFGGVDNDTIDGGSGNDVLYSGSRFVPPTYTQQTTTADSFTGTNDNTDFTGTVTSDEGSVGFGSVGGINGYSIGDADGNEVHTHSFSQDIAGVQVDFNAINTNEQLSFAIDGVAVDLNTLIANGDAFFSGGSNYEINGSGQIVLQSGGNVAAVGSLTVIAPFLTIDVIATGSTGSGFLYEMHVDTNPPYYSDDDSLSGGNDADTFIIEDDFGNDTITGGEGGVDSDVIDMSALSDPVTVTFTDEETGSFTDGTYTTSFSQIEEVILTDQDDVVDATADSNGDFGDQPGISVDGRGGDDLIDGGWGGDSIQGGSGNDTLSGDYGDDTVSGGTGNDRLEGGRGNDVLSGGDGDDTIFGGIEGDTLIGGLGDDILTGGTGNDVFVYTVGDGLDTIVDFGEGDLRDDITTNNDFIDLSRFYDDLSELRADFADDGTLNQSNFATVDYANNDQFLSGEGITFSAMSTEDFTDDNTNVICFTTGTVIRTPRGDVLVEDLTIGDLVTTRDNGPQPIRWIGTTSFGSKALALHPKIRPVLINRGVLGNTRPLLVSPQHGMLFGADHLARATHLARTMPGVRIAHGKREVTYVHLLFDAHQIIYAEDAPSESFYPGPTALKMMDASARRDVLDMVPDLRTAKDRNAVARLYGPTARPFLKRRDIANAFDALVRPVPPDMAKGVTLWPAS